jgi:hypothetical protein
MTMEEVQALRSELQQLSAEAKRFKEELLAARVEELERIAHAPVRTVHLTMPEINMSTDR